MKRPLRSNGAAQPRADRNGVARVAVAGPCTRVKDAVNDQRTHSAGEQVGIGLTELRAVRESEVVQLVVTERPPEIIHVPGDVGCCHVPENRSGMAATGVGETLIGGRLDVLLFCRDREGERRQISEHLSKGGITPQRCAAHDSARIEPNDVEPRSQIQGQERGKPAYQIHSRSTWSTRIHKQGTNPLLRQRRRQTNSRQRDPVTARRVVVQWHSDLRTLKAVATRRHAGAATRAG